MLRARSTFRFYGSISKRDGDLRNGIRPLYWDETRPGGRQRHRRIAHRPGALGVGPGQEVIVPAYLWVSVIAAVVNLGAIPVLADIDDSSA